MGSMMFEAATDEEMAGGGAWLKEPGWYLLRVAELDEQPTSKEGKAIDGIRAGLVVASGPQADKKFDLYVKNPNSAHKDGGRFASKIRTAFVLATGLISEEQLGKSVTIDPQQAVHRLVVAQIDHQKDQAGNPTNFMELSYDNIYHIDSPKAAKSGALDQKVIGLVPKDHRRDPKSFKLPRDGGQGATSSNGTTQTNSQPASAANDDLGGI